MSVTRMKKTEKNMRNTFRTLRRHSTERAPAGRVGDPKKEEQGWIFLHEYDLSDAAESRQFKHSVRTPAQFSWVEFTPHNLQHID